MMPPDYAPPEDDEYAERARQRLPRQLGATVDAFFILWAGILAGIFIVLGGPILASIFIALSLFCFAFALFAIWSGE